MMDKSEYIQQINLLQNQLNVYLVTKYQNRIDTQLTAKQVLLLELISMQCNINKGNSTTARCVDECRESAVK